MVLSGEAGLLEGPAYLAPGAVPAGVLPGHPTPLCAAHSQAGEDAP